MARLCLSEPLLLQVQSGGPGAGMGLKLVSFTTTGAWVI